MSEQFALTSQNLCLALAGKSLLRNITCQVKTGELTMVIGQNGSGKSLLLQALHGLIPLSDGTVDGPAHARTKLVFQKPILLRRSTNAIFDFVAPNVAPEDKMYWLKRAGLDQHSDHPARLLSGGQAQKLMLVAILATEPTLLFLDEPTAHLDYESTDFVEDMLCEARAKGITIIMSSHNKAQVSRLADHILFLHDGALVDNQSADAFFASPQHAAAEKWLEFA